MSPSFSQMDLEELTSKAKEIQEDVLAEILKLNANTEYLERFLQGSSDKELFKKNVPVVTYDDVKPYIERVANGEPSDVISGGPITKFLRSTGTSGGKQKIFPVNEKYNEIALQSLAVSMHFDSTAEQGKAMEFHCINPVSATTSSGLPISSVFSSFFMSDYFKNRPSKCYSKYTSPDQVILCLDYKQSLYCHLLCGLVQRDEVVSVGATFAYALVQAIESLKNNWKKLCSDIRLGHVSEWITDLNCKNAVSAILGGPNPILADVIEQECSNKSWEGDWILQCTPQFRFVHRKNVVLSVKSETTTEEELLKASAHATIVLESSNLMLVGFTCYADISTFPGHYAFYWELKAKGVNDVLELDKKVLVKCCSVLEESFDELYRRNRSKDGSIGALEIRVVQQGTFDCLMEYFVSLGGSIAQYKTPICIKSSSEALAVLEDKVIARFYSEKTPPLDS